MATTPNTLSPLPSRADGLGIFPSGDSFSRSSVYSYGHTRSSTCTVLSYAQQLPGEKTPPPSLTRTTTIRTNLKEIQKSPLPHRFNLVPSSRKRDPEQPRQIPRSSTQWTWKSGRSDIRSDRSTRSPSVYTTSPDPQSTQLVEERNEDRCTILEDLLSDALDSPVFDCIPTFSPPCTPSPQPQTMSSPSFTLVHDQPSHKSPQYSTTPDAIRELRTSVDSRQPSLLDRDRKLSSAFPSLRTPPPLASPRNETDFYEDFVQAPPATPQDVFDAYPEDGPQSGSANQQSSEHRKSWRTISSASSSSKDFFVCDDLDSSNSTYSQASLQDSFGARNPSQASSRRATEGSFASLTSSDSRRRKFAVRRQAIYAEYGFKLAFPDSDSSSSIRHTHMPTSSSRDFLETTGSSRATSAYVDSRSVWSASTSAASIRSQMMQHDGESADEDDDEKPEGPGNSIVPYPSARSLANLSNVERFSVQDAFLSSSRNPLLDDHADLTTSTPPAKPRSQTQQPASFKRITQLTSLPEVEARLPVSNTQVYTSGLDWHPWPPLRLSGIDAENGGSIIRRSSSTLERAQMFAKWQDDPGHHPIIQELLNAVDLAIREWGVGLFAIGKYV